LLPGPPAPFRNDLVEPQMVIVLRTIQLCPNDRLSQAPQAPDASKPPAPGGSYLLW